MSYFQSAVVFEHVINCLYIYIYRERERERGEGERESYNLIIL